MPEVHGRAPMPRMPAIVLAGIGALLAGCPAPRPARPTEPPARITQPADQLPPAAEAPRGRPVRLASWNLKRLGHGKKRLDLAARVIREHDVVALQEVMNPEGVDR